MGGPRPTDRVDADRDFYRAVFESSRDCIKTLSTDGVLLAIADAAREFLCRDDLHAWIGHSWIDFWHGEDRTAAREAVATAAQGGHGRFCGRFAVKGEVRWWDVLVTPMRGADGTIGRLLAVSRDVTAQKQTEHELRTSREQLAAFMESAAIGLHRVGPDGTILWANRAELAMLGYPADEYIGRPIADVHADPAVIDDILSRLSRGERLRAYPSRLRCKDGSLRDVVIDSCVLWEDGRFVHTQCFTRDVTTETRAQQEMRQLAAIVESSDDAILATDLRERIVSWNAGAERMFGYTADEAIGQPVSLLHPPGAVPVEGRILHRLQRGERIDHFEDVRRTRAGELRAVSISASPVFNDAGRMTGMAKILRDITERKQTEQAIRRSEALINRMIDQAPVGIFIVDSAFRLIRFNEKAAPSFSDDAIGQAFDGLMRTMWPAATAERVIAVFRHTLTTGEPHLEPRFGERRSDRGQPEHYDWQIHRLTLPDGQHAVACYFIDITAHISAQERLRETAERLELAVQAAKLGLWRWDAATDLVDLSPRAAAIFGLPPGPHVTWTGMQALIERTGAERARAAVERSVATRTDYQTEYLVKRREDGGEAWVAATGRPVYDGDQIVAMLGFVQDITDRKNAELHLRHQRDVLEQIVRSAPLTTSLELLTTWVESVVHRRCVATVLLASPEGERLRSAAGRRCPESWARYVDGIPIREGVGSCGTAAARKARVVAADIATDPSWAAYKDEALKHGFRACWSTPIFATDRTVLGTFAVYHPEPTQPIPAELEIVDVVTRTAAIAIERERAEQALRESREKLAQHASMLEQRVAERTAKLQETIGELEAFSYSVSHDMRAPLRAMQGYSDRLLKLHASKLEPEAQHFLARINKNAQRLELLVRDVLAYSRVAKAEIELVPIDLDAFVSGVIAQMPEAQREGVTVTVVRPFPLVLAHEAYLSQIVTNLIGNAVKFAAPDRPPQIRVSAQVLDRRVEVAVADNGIGIAGEHFDRIFQIFGRVYPDRQYEGTGIGLAIVNKAVQRMGGTITVASELGRGTTFTFSLQRA